MKLEAVYVVLVGPGISDEPVRWCFVNEEDADRFIAEYEPEGWKSYEPIAHSWDDPHFQQYLGMVSHG